MSGDLSLPGNFGKIISGVQRSDVTPEVLSYVGDGSTYPTLSLTWK